MNPFWPLSSYVSRFFSVPWERRHVFLLIDCRSCQPVCTRKCWRNQSISIYPTTCRTLGGFLSFSPPTRPCNQLPESKRRFSDHWKGLTNISPLLWWNLRITQVQLQGDFHLLTLFPFDISGLCYSVTHLIYFPPPPFSAREENGILIVWNLECVLKVIRIGT